MPRIRLRTQILILQMVIVTASLAAGFGIIIHRTDTQTRTEFARRAQAIAETVASDQEVQAGAAAQSAARRAGHPASAAELAAALHEDVIGWRKEEMAALLARGVARGDVRADVPVDVARELGQSVLWHRLLITGDPITDDLVVDLVDQVLVPFVAPTTPRS